MEIRRLHLSDEALAREAATRLKSEEERHGYAPSLEHLRALLADLDNFLIVASEGRNPVGFLIAYRMPKIARDASMVYLYEIGVDPEYRRRGIATQMIQLLKALCRERDVVEIWVGTENDNAAARALYARTGAVVETEHTIEFVYTRESFMQ